MMTSSLATAHVPMPAHGPSFKLGQPRIIVVHSIECPIERGRALSVAQSMARAAQVSVHYLVDPGATVAGLDESLIGYGAGSVNPAAIHIEQAGYARYTRAQWTTSDGLAMIRRTRELIADISGRRGIPQRLLTDAQLLDAWKGLGPGGITTHAQCSRVIGGTDHSDPGPGFPLDLLLPQTPTAQEDDMPTAKEVVDELLARRIPTVDAASSPPAQTYTVADLLARLVRLAGLTKQDVSDVKRAVTK